jgi:hypothetical protein
MTRFTSTYIVTDEEKKDEIWVLFTNPKVLYKNTYVSFFRLNLSASALLLSSQLQLLNLSFSINMYSLIICNLIIFTDLNF